MRKGKKFFMQIRLEDCRNQIDEIDNQLFALFCKRMEVVSNVAAYKKEHQLPILNQQREDDIIARHSEQAPDELKSYASDFFKMLMSISRNYQSDLFKDEK
jgi:monofunctional chorismate mutase